jgi:NAD(P)-dependent dehydrogenase (short-subunit alcohol dehydrogenase family)
MTDPHRLDGQVAIVTGAAQGIGKGVAIVLAEPGRRSSSVTCKTRQAL